VLPVSILNFCSEESLRVIRGGAGWRDRLSTAGESNLAEYAFDVGSHEKDSEQRGYRPNPNMAEKVAIPGKLCACAQQQQ
jgi:hypothetical protein